MLRRLILPLAVIMIGVIVTVILLRARPEVERLPVEIVPPTVRVIVARAERTELSVHSQGTVVPQTEADLVAEVGGTITWVSPSFDEGGYFERGVPLLRLDPRDYELNVASARAQVAQARVGLTREEAEAEIALEEWQELGDGTPSALVLRQPQLDEARARLEAAEATLAKAELDLSRTTVAAPFSGRLRRKNVDLGEFVNRGTPLATIYSVSVAEIRLPVPDSDLAFLDLPLGSHLGKSGPKVTLSTEFAGARQSWTGRIVRTGGEIDPASRMVPLIAQVEDPFRAGEGGVPMSVGLFVDAEITGRSFDDIYRIPRGALYNGEQLLVVDQENRVRIRDIEILRTTETEVLVKEGLSGGDRVCLTRLDAVIDGMEVKPVIERTDEIEVTLESTGA